MSRTPNVRRGRSSASLNARRGRSSADRARAVSPDVLALIVALSAAGGKQKAIAREAGVSQAHVSRVLAQHPRLDEEPVGVEEPS